MELSPLSVRWLIPEENVPCDIFLHFRGQFAVAIPNGQAVTFKLLEKLAKTQWPFVYIRSSDLPAWKQWTSNRCPTSEAAQAQAQAKEKEDSDPSQLYGNKRAELLSYVQRSLNKRAEDPPLDMALTQATIHMAKVIKLASLDWYFQQFHEPPDLLHHNGRVAFSLAVFCLFHQIASGRELENLLYSALIHELEGDPLESLKTVVSQQTLSVLEKIQRPVPKEVIELIKLHDELCSGKGFPSNKKLAEIPKPVRAFHLFNHFDHYRLQSTGTRRARFDRTKQLMDARIADYDPDLLQTFWTFWTLQVEPIT
jgi:hypothetical protein